MPSRQETVELASQLFQGAVYPEGLCLEDAWLGIYQVLLWYEHVDWGGYEALPHIIEADKLRPPARKRKAGPEKPTVWQHRAAAVERYLADSLRCQAAGVLRHLDLLMGSPPYQGFQRQNPLGIAMAGLVKHVVERFGASGLECRLEVRADEVFPGIAMPGRSTTPSMDLLVLREERPRAIISTKWSLRHDRINDITNECPVYKAAALRLRLPLDYFVVTNEYDPARLQKVVGDDCVNGVAHIHKPLVTEVCELDGRLDSLLDLADLVRQSHVW